MGFFVQSLHLFYITPTFDFFPILFLKNWFSVSTQKNPCYYYANHVLCFDCTGVRGQTAKCELFRSFSSQGLFCFYWWKALGSMPLIPTFLSKCFVMVLQTLQSSLFLPGDFWTIQWKSVSQPWGLKWAVGQT